MDRAAASQGTQIQQEQQQQQQPIVIWHHR